MGNGKTKIQVAVLTLALVGLFLLPAPDRIDPSGRWSTQAGRILAVEDTNDLALGNGTWTAVNFQEIEDTLDCNTTPAEATPYTTFRLKHTGRWRALLFVAFENRLGQGAATDYGLKVLLNDTTYWQSTTSHGAGHAHQTTTASFYFILDASDTTSWTEAGVSKGYATISVQAISNSNSSYISGDAIPGDFPLTVGAHPHSRYMILEWLGY